jgi:hypothetical protein
MNIFPEIGEHHTSFLRGSGTLNDTLRPEAATAGREDIANAVLFV